MANKAEDNRALERYLEKLKLIGESGHVDYSESKEDKDERRKRAKNDYNFFVRYYFPHYAEVDCAPFHIDAANKVLKERNFRGVMEWARGLAKSTHFGVFIPTWLYLFHNDLKTMVLVGESEGKAKILLADLQAEFEANQQIRHDFGNLKQHGDWASGNFITVDNVAFYALGKGQSPRGCKNGPNRPDYIVMDDLDDDQEVLNPKMIDKRVRWIKRALIPSVSPKCNRIILVNNRIAKYCILSNIAKIKKFNHIKVNAVDDKMNPVWNFYTKAFYILQLETMGYVDFESEYKNNPHTEGKIFKEKYFQYKKRLKYREYDRIIAVWDIAYSEEETADCNAIPIVGLHGTEKHVLKGYCHTSSMEEALRWLYTFHKNLPSGIDVEYYAESQFWNTAVSLAMKQVAKEFKFRLPIIFLDRPTQNKYSRILQMLPSFQRLEVFFAEDEQQNNDYERGIEQIKGIEPGYSTHDDFPDALTEAIHKLDQSLELEDFDPQIGFDNKPSDKAY